METWKKEFQRAEGFKVPDSSYEEVFSGILKKRRRDWKIRIYRYSAVAASILPVLLFWWFLPKEQDCPDLLACMDEQTRLEYIREYHIDLEAYQIAEQLDASDWEQLYESLENIE